MSDQGGGSGIPIPSGPVTPIVISGWPGSGISLPRYANIIGYSENAFFGISCDETRYACSNIWTKWQRDGIAQALYEAQFMIEDVLRYPLTSRWIEDEVHGIRSRIVTKWSHVISVGSMADVMLAAGAVVDLTSDPAIITVASILTNTDEIRTFYPGTDQEIIPSRVIASGAQILIYVPKARLVSAAYWNNPESGYNCDDATIYQTSVDVRRIYTDTTKQAKLVFSPRNACTEATVDLCAFIVDPANGILDIKTNTCVSPSCRGVPINLRLSYLAGMRRLERQYEGMVIRLAHSLMPKEPCGCQITQSLWMRDRNIPVVLDAQRLDCPFGISDGAWFAWRTANFLADMKFGRTS